MASCDAQSMVTLAKCFACLTPHQIQLAQTALLCQVLQASNPMASCSAQDLMNSAACLACLSPRELELVQTQLLCEILQAGSGGQGCIICGAVDPVAAPDCDCAIAYNTATGGLWYWNAGTASWVALIGGP